MAIWLELNSIWMVFFYEIERYDDTSVSKHDLGNASMFLVWGSC